MADTETAMVVDEVAEEVVTEAVPHQQPFVLPLLEIIRTAQGQNGIKHGDHMRYRHHCTHRLRSLFKVLRFQHGRTKYQKRKLDLHNISDVRHLHILLFNAERCWAYAMELKKEAEAQPKVALPKRRHLVSRLAKAQVWALELARFAAEKCDTRSALEAEGYCCFVAGNVLLEKESDWQTALAKYSRAKRLFQELAKIGDLEQQSLCLNMVEEMEPALRYCNYQIERKGGAVPDLAALLALGEGGRGGQELLQSKLAALAAESAVLQAASTSYLEWRGQRYPVRNERVKVCLHQAAEWGAQLDSPATPSDPMEIASTSAPAAAGGAASAPAPGTLEHRLMMLDKMSNALTEARGLVRNAVKSSTASEGDGGADELSQLEMALSGTILQRAVERGSLMECDVRERFAAGLIRQSQQGKRVKDKGQFARPEDVARCLDTLTRHLEEYADLGARSGGRKGEELHDICATRILVCQASRCYHVAHAYLAAGKPREAHALFTRTTERAATVTERLQKLPTPAAQQEAAGGTDLAQLAQLAAAYRAVAHADYVAEAAAAADTAQAGVASLGLGDLRPDASAAAAAPAYLVDDLDRWESFAGVSAAVAAAAAVGKSGTVLTAVPPRLVPGAPPLQAVAVRPIMLDTASGHVQYPSLEHRIKKAEKKGGSVLSSLFGWGRAAAP